MTSNDTDRRARVARGGVLVLGGGFAGSHVVRELGASGATIVERRPLPTSPRTIGPHADLMLGSAVGLDARRRVAHMESEAGHLAVAYAELVVALGDPRQQLRRLRLPLDGHGRVRVDATLRVLGASNIWALGDCAALPKEHALHQARRLARHLRADPERTRS
jgi:hypothetical protein